MNINVDRTLEQAFRSVLTHSSLSFSVEELLALAEEDQLGGRDTGSFPDGISPYAAEGQFIYALVRAIQPDHCLEIGCAVGGSAAHILAALDRNGHGRLTSIDIDSESGSMIPDNLRARWELVVADATEIALPLSDFVFEDSDHTYPTTLNILRRAKAMNPHVVFAHDYILCQEVKNAFDETFGEKTTKTLLGVKFMMTGLACWMNPNFPHRIAGE